MMLTFYATGSKDTHTLMCCRVAGKDNETDCSGQLTAITWMRSGVRHFPVAYKKVEDVKPDLLLQLRSVYNSSECVVLAPEQQAAAGHGAVGYDSFPPVSAEQESSVAADSLSLWGSKAITRVRLLRLIWFKKDLGHAHGRIAIDETLEEGLDSDTTHRWPIRLREQKPLPTICPLFARKFGAATAEIIGKVYGESVLES